MTATLAPANSLGLVRQLWFQVLAAMIAGVALGLFAPEIGAGMKPFGDAFIALVRMMIGPVIFVTVVHGIAGMRDMKRVGRLALKSLVYFEIVTVIALMFGLVAVGFWAPGAGMNVDPAAIDTRTISPYVAMAHDQTIAAYLLHILPDTLISAFTQGEVLQVLLASVLFGMAAAMLGERASPVVSLIGSLAEAIFRMVAIVMIFAPIGAFGAIAFTVGRFGASSLLPLMGLILEFFTACFLFTFAVLGGIAWAVGVNIFRLIAYIRDELLVVAATTSSETVLPRLIAKLRRLGCEESIVGFVIPAGYSFNLDGTCLYLTTVAVFLAQATDTPLTLGHQLVLIGILLITSKGAAGVAGAAFVVLAATLSALGTIPVASIALILGIHRILAEGLTFVNVIGNCVATIVMARWEGGLDRARLAAAIGTRAERRAVGLS